MWSYNKQIIVRWLAFALGIIALAIIFSTLAGANPTNLTQIGIKEAFTKLSVSLEFMPFHVWPAIFALITLAFLLGTPSILIFGTMLPLIGFFSSFLVVWLCQIFTTIIATLWAWRKVDQSKLQPQLLAILHKNRNSYISFAFWSRIYYAFPLRTVDMLTPQIHPDDEPLLATIGPAAAAILLRLVIPALWFESLLKLIQNFSADPGGDSAKFLLWSSALVAYTMIPRVPELFICPKALQPVLEAIESQPNIPALAEDPNEISPKPSSQKPRQEKSSGKKPEKQPEPQITT